MLERLLGIFRYFWIKIILTIPAGIFIIEKEHFTIIYEIIIMTFIDSILGIMVSLKYKVFASHKLRKIAEKTIIYLLALASFWVLDCVSPNIFGWTFYFFGVFLIMTELFSNIEKLSLLGLEIPSKLLSKINKNFYTFYFGEDTEVKTKALKNILDKNNDCLYEDK